MKNAIFILYLAMLMTITVLGQAGNALNFDGSNDYVSVTNPTVPIGSSYYTIEAWIKPTVHDVNGIVGWGNYGTTNQVNAVRLGTGGIVDNYWWANDMTYTTGNLTGAWHHIAFTYDGSNRRFYLDGVLKDTQPSSGISVQNSNNFRIGSTNNGEYFNGDIDELRIWNVARTTTEIQSNYNKTVDPSSTGLVAYYKFDEGTGGGDNSSITTLSDATSNHNDGTLTNFALTGSTSNLVSSDAPFPVELNTFTASVNENSVTLKWETETEVNNYGFEIQRKDPPLNPLPGGEQKGWVDVGFVKGNGNSNSPKEYSFTDENITAGSYKYRLKQIDNDGTFEYSDVVEVSFNTPLKFALEQNYPNPFNPSTKIKYSVPSNVKSGTADVKLIVYDILGREIKTLVNEKQQAGNYEVNFNASGLASGMYIYRIEVGNKFSSTKKMILLR